MVYHHHYLLDNVYLLLVIYLKHILLFLIVYLFHQQIVDVHFPEIKKDLVKEAMEIFFDVRKVPGLKKKPSTSELIDWLKLLMADDIPDEILTNRDASKAIPPLYGALVKNEQDVHLLERLAFMNRRDSRG